MRQRLATEPAQCENDELAVRDAAVRVTELRQRRLCQYRHRRLRHSRIAGGDGERIGPTPLTVTVAVHRMSVLLAPQLVPRVVERTVLVSTLFPGPGLVAVTE